MSQEPQGESSTQPRTADEDPVELENLDELRELVKFCPGWIKDPTRHFDHMAVRWETIDPRTATAKQKATWALLTLADLETTDLNASYARTPSEVLSFYQERFRDFTVADFDSMPDKVRSGLRLALMQRGIYAGRGNANFSGVLASLLVMNDLPTWNADELESAKFRWPDALAWRTSVHQTDKGPAYPEAPESIRSRVKSQTQQPMTLQPQTPAHGPMPAQTPQAPPPPQRWFPTFRPPAQPVFQPAQQQPPPPSNPSSVFHNSPPPPPPAPATQSPPQQASRPQQVSPPPPAQQGMTAPPQTTSASVYPNAPLQTGQQGYNTGYNPVQTSGQTRQGQGYSPTPGNVSGPPGPPPGGPYMTPAVSQSGGAGGGNQPIGNFGSSSQTAPLPTQMGNQPAQTPMPVGNPQSDTYYDIPPAKVTNEMCPSTIIGHFKKAWNNENNYTGEAYDVLEDKFRFFLDVCYTSGIRQTQFHAVFSTILTGRAAIFFLYSVPRNWCFTDMYLAMEHHFNTEQNKAQYHHDWTSITFASTKADKKNEGKSDLEILEAMLDKLSLCQRALGREFRGEQQLIAAVQRACRSVPQLQYALFTPSYRYEELASKLRASISTHENLKGARQYMIASDSDGEDGQYYTERRYHRTDRGERYQSKISSRNWKRRCWVCKKEGCWSTKHSEKEQKEAKEKWKANKGRTKGKYATFLTDYEGIEQRSSESEKEDSDDPTHDTEEADAEQYLTAAYLSNQAFHHRVSSLAPPDDTKSDAVFFLDRYTKNIFQGIMPDTGAARVSTVGKEQYLALLKEHPDQHLRMDRTRAGEANIRFGDGPPIESLGTVTVDSPFGQVDFHVMETDTPFLLSLNDMDRLGVYLNNVTNQLVCKNGVTVNVTRKWGHPWFYLESATYFTETELRRLHTRFGHPSVSKLYDLLDKAGHDVDINNIKEINKFCHHCQIKGKAPQRFKFSLKDPDMDFNYEVIVDIMYLDERPVLHIVDAATGFQAARFMRSISAKETWEMLKQCWIDTYLGPPDVITHDAGTNFDSTEFRNEARLAGITCHQVPVEAHWSIGKVEECHGPIRRAYEIITDELEGSGSRSSRLQMAVKAVNDTANPDGLVPTLLVFGAYPKINMDSPPTPTQTQRAQAVQKAMVEIKKIKAQRSIRDALNTRNGPNTVQTLPMSLPIGSEVLVFREKGGWKGPHKVVAVTDKDVTVVSNSSGGTSTFRSTHVKPYTQPREGPVPPKPLEIELPKPTFNPDDYRIIPEEDLMMANDLSHVASLYVTTKERDNMALALKLRADGKILAPGKPYEASDLKELDALFEEGILQPEMYDPAVHKGATIFKSRMVREIKAKNTPAPYEKSRLVVQGYGDPDKEFIMTYAPTIQRASQRLILALAPMLRRLGMKVMIRDITMAYTQSKTPMQRTIFVRLPAELKNKYPEGTLLRVVKPLYGLAESGTYWFETYSRHHQRELRMKPSAFDPCLLITNSEPFGITGLQTDDTLNVGTIEFLAAEDKALAKAGIKARPQKILDKGTEDFNGSRITVHDEGYGISTTQKGQAEKLELLDPKAPDMIKRFVEQRARGAYIASICQPEAAFDYSTAAQHLEPGPKEAKALNARIKWQLDNQARGLNYVDLDPQRLCLYVFVDGSFANNKDLSSQIGYIIVLGNEESTGQDNEVRIKGNIIHWSSTKCKRVTRSVLASEIYGMVQGFDVGYVIHHTINTILERLSIPKAPLVLCTDSFSLYQCLVQMGSTNEKRLMIDLMALRQSYENREIDDIRWIHGTCNPADAMTKASPNEAMRTLVEDNQIDLRLEGWVKREMKDEFATT